ncbi:MAG: deoxyribodipyrimidine photo-lyase/cryptochrome family protein [Planctomycetaceae bacterium]|nr:deoxyribodipyrimidine photo-lyase/cryptochrome family protein [Planctomycetaceae bacterium]
MQVVWFKRDLRTDDHGPLARAAKLGPCLCLYAYEPELIHSPEFDASHLRFINESLTELEKNLNDIGGKLTLRVGRMPDILAELHEEIGISGLWSHQETGNKITYDRDRRVTRWAKANSVPWRQLPQNGVVRRLASRDGWSKQRNTFFASPPIPAPTRMKTPPQAASDGLQHPPDFQLAETSKTNLQQGGESVGKDLLNSFLYERGEHYNAELSSPVTAWNSCSRISPYLTWGCLSMRRVTQSLKHRQMSLRESRGAQRDTGGWLKSLKAFESRLSWHCHFIQKLEDEPAIEFENMSRAYDGIREESFDQNLFDAWCAGRTGYPLVDACMRALHQRSWINFRMRAMLVSFASYHLWLHWRPTAVYLAKHFLDFEPGIHFSQVQMQSGTTGINAVRIYSPIKQVLDQDPQGIFIRQYLPELNNVPDDYLAEPHKMPMSVQSRVGCLMGKNYPKPIVDHSSAYKSARDKIYAVKREPKAKDDTRRVFNRHGSRKRPLKR